jgi:predicted RNA-binding Zn-ribbon protein involved in translation (DUF1610 family)
MSSAELTGQVTCASCKKTIRYPASKAGLSGKCPGCGNKITLPALSKVEDAPPKPAQQLVVAPPPVPAVRPAQPVVQTQIIQQVQAPIELPSIPEEPSELSRFMSEGQNASMIAKLLDRVKQICTSTEEIMYMAVQQKPIANLSPDAIVLTSRRAIIFRQKMLGTMEFVDVPWSQVGNVHVKENMIGATVSITGSNGHSETVDYLPKEQARKVYRHGQEMEEKMVEWRRNRKMEEDRNAADQVIVNTAVANQPQSAPAADDPVQRLGKLKTMLDAGLIDQSEYDAAKARILSSI